MEIIPNENKINYIKYNGNNKINFLACRVIVFSFNKLNANYAKEVEILNMDELTVVKIFLLNCVCVCVFVSSECRESDEKLLYGTFTLETSFKKFQ